MSISTSTLRSQNMEKRRQRIVAEARKLLASGGNGALNLRDLADQANLTVPTIYNLIGKKEDVLLAVADEVLAEIESHMTPVNTTEPLSVATALVAASINLFSENEDFYRAAFLAVEGLDESGQHHHEVERIYAWAGALVSQGLDACLNAKLLRGRMPAELMSQLMTRTYRMNCRGWAFGHYDIEAFRQQATNDLYVILAADAVETFHSRLIREIKKNTTQVNLPTSKRKIKQSS